MNEWLMTALRGDIVLRSLKVAVIIGTLLVAINQGDLILSGRLDTAAVWKIPLTYLVPYCVATYGAVSAILAANRSGGQDLSRDE
ncbi:MAG: nitrate/nitrite transporter NrtS [Woeseiaceae bacterium]|nr:nitrate/nitrite transporter NrtS [Woeseiaceae bacterium]